MLIRRRSAYLLLIPGLVALGCGGSEIKRDAGDAGRAEAGGLDSARDGAIDRVSDVPITPDGRDTPLGTDTQLEAGVDVPPADGAVDVARLDGPTDARDAAGDTRDAGPPRLDTGTLDVPAVDGGPADVPITTDGPITQEAGTIDTTLSNLFVATLTGAEVVPMVATSATGAATFELSATGTQLTYHLTHNVSTATGAAIFLGPGGENGGQAFALTPLGPDMTGTLTITATDAANLASGMWYVGVQSTGNPNGEIRGQILRPGESLWVANLTGAQEAPPVTTSATGHAALILNGAATALRFHVTTSGLTATAVQIQVGIAALAGGAVAHDLAPLSATMDGVLTAAAADVQNLADRHLYINVVTAANPSGEIRGQVLMPGEALYSASMNGASEVPAVVTTATGAAQFILDPSGTSLMYEGVFVGLVADASHIHPGVVGVAGGVLYPLTLNATGTGVKGSLTVTATDVANLNAAGYYINAHTVAHPAGEIRGQIIKQ